MDVTYLHFETLNSTNTWVKEHAHSLEAHHLTCVSAEEQTAGRGRFNRPWISPKGENIYATLYFCVSLPCSYLLNIGQILSLSCIAVLEKLGFFPEIKWPNDILIDKHKMAGILCEAVSLKEQIGIVLGFGLNVNMSQKALESIDQNATSLAKVSCKHWELKPLLHSIVAQFLQDLELLQRKGFVHFRASYERHLAFKGQYMSCSQGKTKLFGYGEAVDDEGRLLLRLEGGSVVHLSSGEVRIHG